MYSHSHPSAHPVSRPTFMPLPPLPYPESPHPDQYPHYATATHIASPSLRPDHDMGYPSSGAPDPLTFDFPPGTTIFPCPWCTKRYEGRNARSVWRRHAQDKHRLPCNARKSRGDKNADSPQDAEEKKRKTVVAKRNWARDHRVKKKLIDEGLAAEAIAAYMANLKRRQANGENVDHDLEDLRLRSSTNRDKENIDLKPTYARSYTEPTPVFAVAKTEPDDDGDLYDSGQPSTTTRDQRPSMRRLVTSMGEYRSTQDPLEVYYGAHNGAYSSGWLQLPAAGAAGISHQNGQSPDMATSYPTAPPTRSRIPEIDWANMPVNLPKEDDETMMSPESSFESPTSDEYTSADEVRHPIASPLNPSRQTRNISFHSMLGPALEICEETQVMGSDGENDEWDAADIEVSLFTPGPSGLRNEQRLMTSSSHDMLRAMEEHVGFVTPRVQPVTLSPLSTGHPNISNQLEFTTPSSLPFSTPVHLFSNPADLFGHSAFAAPSVIDTPYTLRLAQSLGLAPDSSPGRGQLRAVLVQSAMSDDGW